MEEEGFEVGPEGFSLAEGKGRFRRGSRVNRWASVSLTGKREAPPPCLLQDAVPGCHGDDRLLWASSVVKLSEQKRRAIPLFPLLPRL